MFWINYVDSVRAFYRNVIRSLLPEGCIYVRYDECIYLLSQSQRRVWGICIRCRRRWILVRLAREDVSG